MSLSFSKGLFVTIFLLTANNLLADNGQPDLWQIEKNGKISYLFGSIHLGSNDMYPLSDVVNKAYARSEHLVVEINLRPDAQASMQPLVQKYGFNLTVPLEKRLSPKGLIIYQQACQKKPLPCQQFSSYQAWFLSVQLSLMSMQKLGYKDELGIDKHFLALAHQSKKDIISLESAESQFKLLDSFNQQQQESMLIQSLQATKKDFISLFDAWKTGDEDALLSMFQADYTQPEDKAIYEALFDERNIKMVKQISENLNAGKSLFVVVGAGHIIGENGIVDLLKKEGYSLAQIQ
jgi:uncharacterized protein YbaP (TraB family)